jgi:competence protein ComEC
MRRAAPFALILFLLLSLRIAPNPAQAQAEPLFQISFIDVGQGDAILLRDGSGFDVLVDGGRPSAGPAVLDSLRQQDVADLDALIATHPDQDHIGGLIDVLQAADLPIKAAFYNGYPGDTERWFEFTGAVAAEGLELKPAQSPQAFAWGQMAAEVLHPPPGLVNPDPNDASIVLWVDFGEIEALLTGDIEAGGEADLLAQGTPLSAEVLKVAHHGSHSSSTADFLNSVSPEIAIISTGPNSYGHPHPETLLRLAEAGASTWRTDFLGTIVVTSNGISYQLSPQPVYLPMILGSDPGESLYSNAVPLTEP